MKLCDLHTHSVFSDGTWTPEALLAEAERIGLGAIALTDHNTVAGLHFFLEAAKGRAVEAIPGVEFSSDYGSKDVHIVALFVKPEHYDTITAVLADAQERKERSNRELVENLAAAGITMDYDAIKEAASGSINRAHIAGEMVRLGYAESVKDAFNRYLAPEHGFYHPPKRMTSFEAIDFIKSLGAVAVLAHPLLTFDEKMLREFLQEAVTHGLDAMETEYSTYDEQTTDLARSIAGEFEIASSGGSDFHGDRKPDIFLGTGKGTLAVPVTILEELRRISAKKAKME